MIGRSGLIRVPSATVRKLVAIGGHFGFYWDLLRIHNRSVTLYPLQPTVHLQRLMAEAEILVDPSNVDTYAEMSLAGVRIELPTNQPTSPSRQWYEVVP